jgi:hypothetical protein
VTTGLAAPRVVVEAPRLLDPDKLSPAPRRGPSLEDAVLRVAQELRQRGSAPCLVCGEATDAASECTACGALLS